MGGSLHPSMAALPLAVIKKLDPAEDDPVKKEKACSFAFKLDTQAAAADGGMVFSHAHDCLFYTTAHGLAGVLHADIKPSVLKFGEDGGEWAAAAARPVHSGDFGADVVPFSVALSPSETVAAVCCSNGALLLVRLPDCAVVGQIDVGSGIEDCCWLGESTLVVTLADDGGVQVLNMDGSRKTLPVDMPDMPLCACTSAGYFDGVFRSMVYFATVSIYPGPVLTPLYPQVSRQTSKLTAAPASQASTIYMCNANLDFVKNIEPEEFLEDDPAENVRSEELKISQVECIGTGFLFVGLHSDVHNCVVIDLENIELNAAFEKELLEEPCFDEDPAEAAEAQGRPFRHFVAAVPQWECCAVTTSRGSKVVILDGGDSWTVSSWAGLPRLLPAASSA